MAKGGDPQQTETDQTTTTTSSGTSSIDVFSQNLRKNFLDYAARLFSDPGSNQFYPGTLTAGPSPDQLASFALIRALATDPRSHSTTGLADIAASAAPGAAAANLAAQQFLVSPTQVNPLSNPFLMGALEAANRNTIGQLTTQALPAIRRDANLTGGFGGSRQGIAEGSAVTGTAQAISDSNVRALADAYQRGVGNLATGLQLAGTPAVPLSQAANLRGEAIGQSLRLASALGTSGSIQQQLMQNAISSEIQRFMFNLQQPLQNTMQFGQLLSALTPFGQTSSGTSTSSTQGTGTVLAPGTSPLQGLLGGAATGLGFSLMGQSLGATGALGTVLAPQFAIPAFALIGLLGSQ